MNDSRNRPLHFVRRTSLTVVRGKPLKRIAKHMFAILKRNSDDPVSHFLLPAEDNIEICKRVALEIMNVRFAATQNARTTYESKKTDLHCIRRVCDRRRRNAWMLLANKPNMDHTNIAMGNMSHWDGDQSPTRLAFGKSNAQMHREMIIKFIGNVDYDFIQRMIPNHQKAIEMAKIELELGSAAGVRKLANSIIAAH
ncbi:MAG: hypothetical protein ACI814_004536 [Mariniblastus sp.]